MHFLSRPSQAVVALALLGLPLALLPSEAEACGGTFCDQAQNNMPVDQSGETIVFVLADDHTEAHIQIQYDPDTDAEKFGWIVPMTDIPEFEVASQQFFINLLNGTVPVYGFNTQFEPCGYGGESDGYDSCYGTGGNETSAGGTAGTGDTGDDEPPEPPEVLLRDTVGAFDVVVLKGKTAEVVMTWLGEAGYYQDPAAEPILQEYIDDGYIFAAFKLTQGVGVDEIHPVSLRYPGNEPCVPIKLTRIAAQADMDIRTLFLGKGRVAPTNYHHVILNEAQLDWPSLVANYKEVVSLAVDSAPAEGHAFVTEYAGPSSTVSQSGLYSDKWDHSVFAEIKPFAVVDTLSAQGLVECAQNRCTYNHPLIEGLLHQYVPVPEGLMDGEFYSCLECYEGLIDTDAYVPALFAEAILERVIEPGMHAVDLLETWPYLTRLYTTMSPEEMTIDPIFHENPDLPPVDKSQVLATQWYPCDSAPEWNLPSGFVVPGNWEQTWPAMPPEMPWAQRIEIIPPVGAPQVEIDNTQLIYMLLGALKVDPGIKVTRDCHDDSDTSNSNSSSSASSSTTGGLDDDGACTCTSNEKSPVGAGLIALGALGFLRRRRRA